MKLLKKKIFRGIMGKITKKEYYPTSSEFLSMDEGVVKGNPHPYLKRDVEYPKNPKDVLRKKITFWDRLYYTFVII